MAYVDIWSDLTSWLVKQW